VGVHSGPVTAGVLRSERSRFQLFGDTVNTAARMEQTGRLNMIQISQATADLLIVAGKEHWIKPRENVIEAKGKGMLRTYWALPVLTSKTGSTDGESVLASSDHTMHMDDGDHTDQVQRLLLDKTIRLVDWNVDILQRMLKSIVAHRQAVHSCKHSDLEGSLIETSSLSHHGSTKAKDCIPLNEVVEIVSLPRFDPMIAKKEADVNNVEISEKVVQQLREFVMNIAAM
jgi:hypothetical protein